MATFFTDFSEYTTGQQPSDWSTLGTAGTFAVVADAGATGGKVLRCATAEALGRALVWDAVADVADVEIVGRMRFSHNITNHQAALCARLSDSVTGYRALMTYASSTLTRCRNERIDGQSSFYSIASGSNLATPTGGLWIWQRLNIVGNAIKQRYWLDGDPEPETWNISITNTAYPSAGAVGVWLQTVAGQYTDIDVFGVGTAGDPAPKVGSNFSLVVDVTTEDAVFSGNLKFAPHIQLQGSIQLEDVYFYGEIENLPANFLSIDIQTADAIVSGMLRFAPNSEFTLNIITEDALVSGTIKNTPNYSVQANMTTDDVLIDFLIHVDPVLQRMAKTQHILLSIETTKRLLRRDIP